ncbi:hypothetical protein TRFO_28610 [Tritrichomonas foetus]|uniref:Uncharacterized protein n=1 Tax=Tritrichomonas foetus TaxID=1144522 RepID=A0A1J4JXW8_9EUKA|nr:hypothetical protein TRFO_28610 [Tritrichomonas foetus]|eukprot:OHT04007.1 hypothetical protein TRFO_28610 [Tritrichomonas foetus]
MTTAEETKPQTTEEAPKEEQAPAEEAPKAEEAAQPVEEGSKSNDKEEKEETPAEEKPAEEAPAEEKPAEEKSKPAKETKSKNQTKKEEKHEEEEEDDGLLHGDPKFDRPEGYTFKEEEEVYMIDPNGFDLWEGVITKIVEDKYAIHYPEFPQDDEEVTGTDRILPRTDKNKDLYRRMENNRKSNEEEEEEEEVPEKKPAKNTRSGKK